MKDLKADGIDKVNTIIFDIDGTLSEDVSWLKITQELGASVETHSKIFSEFKIGNIKYQEAKSQLIDLWKSTNYCNKNYLSNMFLKWPLKKSAEQTIKYLLSKYKLCLISGSVDLYVQTIANKLDIKDWYANTTLIWNSEGELIDFDYTLDQAKLKLDQFNDFISRNEIDSEKCAVVGDGDNDVLLFKTLKYSVAVNKDTHPELEELATYKIVDLKELIKIL